MASKIDVIYSDGKAISADFDFYYTNLKPLLMKYAAAICKETLRQVEEHLVTEMVDDLLMDLAAFEGRSQFSTWVHSYFRYRCLTELRYRTKNLGEALVEDITWDHSMDDRLVLVEVQQSLTSKQQAVVQARLEGYTAAEIAGQLGLSERSVYWLWESVLEDVQNNSSRTGNECITDTNQ